MGKVHHHNKMTFNNGLKILILSCLIFAIPICVVIVFHHQLPIGDEWDDNIIIYFKFLKHHLFFQDLFAFHNEHRQFLSRVFYLANYIFFPKNSWLVNLISYCFALASFILIIVKYEKMKSVFHMQAVFSKSIWVWILFAGLLFSSKNWNVWEWSYLIIFPMTLFFFLTAVFLLQEETLSYKRLFACIFFSILAMLSSANGLFVWAICFLIMLLLKTEKEKIALYGIIALISVLFFVHGGRNFHFHISQIYNSIHYFFLFLGNIINSSPRINVLLGVSVFVLYGLMVYFCLNKTKEKQIYLFVWASIGLFSICNAIAGSLLRVNFSPIQALSSRYSLYASLIYISVICLFFILKNYLNNIIKFIYWLFIIGLIYLMISSFHQEIRMIIFNEYKLPSEIALPYKVYLDADSDLYPFKNSRLKNRLIKYYHSQIYSLGQPVPNFLGREVTNEASVKLGKKILGNNFNYQITPSNNTSIRKPFTTGNTILGYIVLPKEIDHKKFSGNLLFLDKNNKVIGIGVISEPIIGRFRRHTSFEGFTVSKQFIYSIVWLYKNEIHMVK